MMMPVMTGADCLQGLRECSPDSPVIIVPGLAGNLDIETIIKNRDTAFVHKPYKIEDLTGSLS